MVELKQTLFLLLTLLLLDSAALPQSSPNKNQSISPKTVKRDVIYYPTPNETVAAMLKAANIQKTDVLYDLGSGDGRIPIQAAIDYGIQAVGVEIDSELVAKARAAAKQANVADKVSFKVENFFRTNLRKATIVTLYLSETLNLSLKAKMLRELPPGARIVSHDFAMGNWKPDQTIKVPWVGKYNRTVYVWTVPEKQAKTIKKNRFNSKRRTTE